MTYIYFVECSKNMHAAASFFFFFQMSISLERAMMLVFYWLFLLFSIKTSSKLIARVFVKNISFIFLVFHFPEFEFVNKSLFLL